MLCQNCNENEANVKYTQIINGVKKEMALCEECSKKLGLKSLDFNMPIDFSSFLGDFLNEYDDSAFMPLLSKPKQLKCDKCGMSYDEFINQGKFGCDNCYEVFSDKIDPILKRLHGSNRYTGRKASISKEMKKEEQKESKESKVYDKDSKENQILMLKEELKQLIKEEKYEEAAVVRDKIKKMEEE